jgi:hypothetical protein
MVGGTGPTGTARTGMDQSYDCDSEQTHKPRETVDRTATAQQSAR